MVEKEVGTVIGHAHVHGAGTYASADAKKDEAAQHDHSSRVADAVGSGGKMRGGDAYEQISDEADGHDKGGGSGQ